jgi:hypothetical protein
MSTVHPSPFLRKALLLDAAASGATAVLLIAAAGFLDGLLGLPVALMREAGLILVPFVGFVIWIGTREVVARGSIWTIIAANAPVGRCEHWPAGRRLGRSYYAGLRLRHRPGGGRGAVCRAAVRRSQAAAANGRLTRRLPITQGDAADCEGSAASCSRSSRPDRRQGQVTSSLGRAPKQSLLPELELPPPRDSLGSGRSAQVRLGCSRRVGCSLTAGRGGLGTATQRSPTSFSSLSQTIGQTRDGFAKAASSAALLGSSPGRLALAWRAKFLSAARLCSPQTPSGSPDRQPTRFSSRCNVRGSKSASPATDGVSCGAGEDGGWFLAISTLSVSLEGAGDVLTFLSCCSRSAAMRWRATSANLPVGKLCR